MVLAGVGCRLLVICGLFVMLGTFYRLFLTCWLVVRLLLLPLLLRLLFMLLLLLLSLVSVLVFWLLPVAVGCCRLFLALAGIGCR